MELTQANQILEVAFKREHRAYAVWQRAKTSPTKTDIFKMIKDTEYLEKLETKQKQLFADCKYWEDRIKDGTYKTHPFDTNSNGFSCKKYYKLETA